MKSLIVIDVEATCWENNQTPPGQQSEIIEIGICLLDGEISKQRSILVRPERSKVSPFCTELTTLTQEMVDTGIPFREACALLESEYDSPNVMWGSWGDYDRKMFEQQCASFGVPYPFSDKHTNLKKLFARVFRLPRPTGMAGALEIANLSLVGTHHRGGDDAYNIARLTQLVLEKRPNALES